MANIGVDVVSGGPGRRGVGVARAVKKIIDREIADLDAATEKGVKATGKTLNDRLRGETRRAGLKKLAGTWRLNKYQSGFKTAAFVYSKAQAIMELADKGGTVRPKRTKYLAIWLPAAGRTAGSGGGRRSKTPADFIGKKNIHFIPPRGKSPARLVRVTKSRVTLLFFLVKQTRHHKRINIAAAARAANENLAPNILKEMRRGAA